jgi:hypothetical protein
VHHTDVEREYAYDRNPPIGTLEKALDEATAKGWPVVDMKHDWKTISLRQASFRWSTNRQHCTETIIPDLIQNVLGI